MKMKTKLFKCPLCGKEMTKYLLYRHFNLKCQYKNSITMYEFACKIEGKDLVDLLIQKYIDGYPFYELHRSTSRKTLSEIPCKILQQIFNEKQIQCRSISESKHTEISQQKYQRTIKYKYGENITNVSQVQEIKIKKAQTFLKHYGVDNIRKYKPFYDYVNDYMIKTYGKKRLSCWENLSAVDREKRLSKMSSTKAINGFYDSKLEERIDRILTTNNIKHKRCFWLYHHPYDFILGDHVLLEVNGDYWHANPKFYKADDIMINGKTAAEIWEYDKKFKDCLQNSKFKIIYLWEDDIKQMSDNDILNWIQQYI